MFFRRREKVRQLEVVCFDGSNTLYLKDRRRNGKERNGASFLFRCFITKRVNVITVSIFVDLEKKVNK